MSALWRGLAALLLLASSACAGGDGPAVRGGSLVEELVAEAARVGALVSASRLLVLLLLIGAGVLATRLFDAAIRLVWRLGLDPQHRLGIARRLADVLVFGGLFSWLVTKLLTAAPVLAGLAAIVAAAGSLWALARPVEDLAAGLGIVLRGRIHEGDHVRIGEHHGTVAEIGLMRLVLRDPEGATVFVPHRLLDQSVVQIHRDRRQIPVQVHLATLTAPRPAMLDAVRQIALLSPWRIPGTPVRVELAADERGIDVELQTFADAGVRLAAAQIRAATQAWQQRVANAAADSADAS